MDYEFNYGIYSSQNQYNWVIDNFINIEMECEIITAVPNNYYSGKIKGSDSDRILIIETPFVFGNNMNELQINQIQKMQIEKFSQLPCYDEWLQLNQQDMIKWGLHN